MDSSEARKLVSSACERCRGHKVRCERPNLSGTPCLRCKKAGVDCIPHIAKRKPPKEKLGVPKEGLTFIGLESAGAANSTTFIGLEAAGPASSTVESSSRPSSPPQQLLLPYTTVASYTRTLPAIVSNPQPTANSAKAPVSRPGSGPGHLSHESAVSQEPTSGPEKSAAPRVTVQSLVSSTSLEVRALADVSLSVSQLREFWEQHHRYSFRNSYLDHVVRSITVQRIQRLPAAFEPMAALFPFVKLPKRSSLNNLLQQRPLLMLAILTVTSYESSSLQYALADVFRNVALARIGECEKSLDLVQGLLVFMAWNHHYMEPRKMIIHTLLGACSGSLIDLEVHSTQPQSSDEVRAYLGCYYLTCCLAMFSSERYRFPPCADFMVDQAYDLASKAEYESDKMLPGLIQMCQFLRDIGDSLQNAAPYKVHTLESIIRTTNHRWDSVKLEICSPLKHCPLVRRLSLATEIYYARSKLSVPLVGHDQVSSSSYRIKALRGCLKSCEAVLETLITLDARENELYTFLSLFDWLTLVYAMSTLGSLAKPDPPEPTWDPREQRIFERFTDYRDRICQRMPRFADSQDDNTHFIERFRRLTHKMLKILESDIELSKSTTPEGLYKLAPIQVDGLNSAENARDSPLRLPGVHPTCDMGSRKFPWMFLQGSIS